MHINVRGTRKIISNVSSFTPRYEFPKYSMPLTDFKGHQVKALKTFEKLLPQMNMIIELRDIRAPLSTRNVAVSYTHLDVYKRQPIQYITKVF